MKGIYTILQIILSAALIRFGEKVGTGNMWYVLAAIITSYMFMDLIYKVRRYSERSKRKKVVSRPTNVYSEFTPIPKEGIAAEENARIKVRHFYDDSMI